MKQYFRFRMPNTQAQPDWLDESTEHFAMAENEDTWWYVPFNSPQEAAQTLKTHGIDAFEEVSLNDYVDWGVQWAEHSPDFKDYSLQINLAKYADVSTELPILHLKAGPGFGDLSHPTTRLTLGMMAKHVTHKEVLDIGCGSGILSFAALLFGAKKVYGVDIDREAIHHAKENARLNEMQDLVTIEHPDTFKLALNEDLIILMNMIRTQQHEAWAAWKSLHHLNATLITSGILAEEKESYYQDARQRNWKLLEEKQEGDWMAFHWKQG